MPRVQRDMSQLEQAANELSDQLRALAYERCEARDIFGVAYLARQIQSTSMLPRTLSRRFGL